MKSGSNRGDLSLVLRVTANAIEDFADLIHGSIRRISARIWQLSNAVDPDHRACPLCGEPGGAHLDCDIPSLGRMTATERRMTLNGE